MPSTINNKRQREDSRDVATVRATSVQRDPKEIRTSISSLHEKPHLSDITVSVQLSNEHEAQDFQCISALLASASRVLEAMLFGPMADASLLDQPRHLRTLRLRGTEPWCFEQMLSFIHGQHICELQPCWTPPEPVPLFRSALLSPSPHPYLRPRLQYLSSATLSLSNFPPPHTHDRPAAPPPAPALIPPPPLTSTALTMDTAVPLHEIADYYEVCLGASSRRRRAQCACRALPCAAVRERARAVRVQCGAE